MRAVRPSREVDGGGALLRRAELSGLGECVSPPVGEVDRYGIAASLPRLACQQMFSIGRQRDRREAVDRYVRRVPLGLAAARKQPLTATVPAHQPNLIG